MPQKTSQPCSSDCTAVTHSVPCHVSQRRHCNLVALSLPEHQTPHLQNPALRCTKHSYQLSLLSSGQYNKWSRFPHRHKLIMHHAEYTESQIYKRKDYQIFITAWWTTVKLQICQKVFLSLIFLKQMIFPLPCHCIKCITFEKQPFLSQFTASSKLHTSHILTPNWTSKSKVCMSYTKHFIQNALQIFFTCTSEIHIFKLRLHLFYY